MYEVASTLILAMSIIAMFHKKILTDFICVHLLWGASLCSTVFLINSNEQAAALAMLFAEMAILWQTSREFFRLYLSVMR